MLFSLRLFICPKPYRYLNSMLGFIFVAKSVLILVFALVVSGLIHEFGWLLKLPGLLTYAIPGAMYIYVRGMIKNQGNAEAGDWRHLLPFLFGFVDVLPFYLDTHLLNEALQNLSNDTFIFQSWSGYLNQKLQYILFPILYWSYLIAIFKLMIKHGFLKGYKQKSVREKWILHSYIFVVLIQVFATFQLVVFHLLDIGFRYESGLSSPYVLLQVTFVLLIVLYLIYNPTVLYGHLFALNSWQSDFQKSNTLSIKKAKIAQLPTSEQMDEKAMMKNDLAAANASEFIQMMVNKQLYLNPNFQLSDLSSATKIPLHQCSSILNNILNKNFRDWTNEFRINHFIERYKIDAQLKTIEALAYESGFKNTATFYNAFKKTTNLSPSKYFEQAES